MTEQTYLRDAGWDERMALLEELFDPPTIERLERVGVGPGWHALEVGAGRGSIAAWLARRVGPPGRVVATDLDTSDLEALSKQAVEVMGHDVLSDDFPAGSFDLVHCRAVLVHLTDPTRALERMVRWLRPGGVLLAEEPWTDVAQLSPDPVAARAARALEEASQSMDGGFARRLPTALKDAGLQHVEAEGRLEFFEGGSRRAAFYGRVLEGAAVPLVARGELDREEVERLRARFRDPGWSDCGWPRIAAWGRKPGVNGGPPE